MHCIIFNMMKEAITWQKQKQKQKLERGGEEKNKSNSEFLSYNLMLNSGNKYSSFRVVRKKISERNKKP